MYRWWTDGFKTILNGLRYRVAAPSIRIVPWAALASCWPLPQQLLPVSATGGGRRRCTLTIFSGKIFIVCQSGKSADFPGWPFHGWIFAQNRIFPLDRSGSFWYQ
jgi:hypothetical protein